MHVYITIILSLNRSTAFAANLMSWTVSNKYIYKICKGNGTHRHYIQADTLLSICYCWRYKFIMKIDTKIHFRYTLFRSPQCYFLCHGRFQFKRAVSKDGIYLLLKNLNSEKNPHGITSIRMIQLYKNAIVEFLKVLFLSF